MRMYYYAIEWFRKIRLRQRCFVSLFDMLDLVIPREDQTSGGGPALNRCGAGTSIWSGNVVRTTRVLSSDGSEAATRRTDYAL